VPATTPVLYLPTVAGGFVTGMTAAVLGAPDWGQLAFGAALFSWFAIEPVLLHRLYTGSALPAVLRPTLGIQPAPPPLVPWHISRSGEALLTLLRMP
jgi:tellurite resistance protein